VHEPTTEGSIDPEATGTGKVLEKEIHLATITEARRTFDGLINWCARHGAWRASAIQLDMVPDW